MITCLQKLLIPVIPMVVIWLMGCSASYHRDSADREVYHIIEEKSAAIEGMPSYFTIEQEEYLPIIVDSTTEIQVIGLAEAVEIAVNNSRSYQSQKERLYSQALSLSASRHQFDFLYSGSASGRFNRNPDDKTLSGALSFGVSRMLATGADLSASITTNLLRYISGEDPGDSAVTTLATSLTQPLLRGAGSRITMENLTQAEREMIYAIREFVRFRRSFSVGIAKRYYNLLQRTDQLRNSWNNYQNLVEQREREELLAQAGRTSEFRVDQVRQEEFRARDRWIREEQAYQNALDEFKIELGLPTDVAIELEPAEMDILTDRGLVAVDLSLEDAIQIAEENRLDLKTTEDRLEDARRRIEVLKDALRPGLDLVLSYRDVSAGRSQPLNFSGDRETYSAGLNLDLPLDRRSQRNSYRQSLIGLNAADRNLSERYDRIKLEVRGAFRSLDQAKQSYVIQQNSVALAERRVESTTLLQQAGRASTRDVLDARESLLEAQNALSRALVDYSNAKLDLFIAMETLKIDDRGLWGENYNLQPFPEEEESNEAMGW